MKKIVLLILIAAQLVLLDQGLVLAAQTVHVLTGRIFDAASQPLAGAEVSLFPTTNVKKPADYISNRTDDDGKYQVAVPEGEYWAVAAYRVKGNTFGPLELGDKHSGEPSRLDIQQAMSMDFTVMDLREAARQVRKRNEDLVRLSGRLLDQDGKLVELAFAMANKSAAFKEMPGYLSAWSDGAGAYILYLPKGRYFLGAGQSYPPLPTLILPKEIVLEKDMDGVDITIFSDQ